jgi:hypothetical protein
LPEGALAFVLLDGLGLGCPPRPQRRDAGIQLYEEEGWEVRVLRRLRPQPGWLCKAPPAPRGTVLRQLTGVLPRWWAEVLCGEEEADISAGVPPAADCPLPRLCQPA